MITGSKAKGLDNALVRTKRPIRRDFIDGERADKNSLSPINEEAARFLALLDAAATSFTFQTSDDDKNRKDRRLARILHGTFDQRSSELVRLNNQGAGIFVTINETDGKGRAAKNITRVRALFVDLDGAPLDPVAASDARPHIIVESSPRRFHLYWLVGGAKLDDFGPAQRTLATRFGGDSSVVDLPRVMRLPGFDHHKGEPFLTRIVRVIDRLPYALADLATLIGSNDIANRVERHADRPVTLSPRRRDLNTVAIENYDKWVPEIFGGDAVKQRSGGYRVSSAALGRDLEEDLSFHAEGIHDFGIGDQGDPREGRRTPIEIVMEHTEHKDPAAAAAWLGAQLGYPANENWREVTRAGLPRPTMHNARVAITLAGIECSHDTFHNKFLFGNQDDEARHELQPILGEVTDNGIIRLRQLLSDQFGVDFGDKATRDAVRSLALEHCFDPVRDMLDMAESGWDGVQRLDRMAVDYLNADDTPLNRAIARKMMIAAVRRARFPGVKFDNIVVLESPEGWNKSTAFRVLAGDENFSDMSIIGQGGREVQEQLSEVWIHENAELAGMRKAEVEIVKSFASRQVDIARPAYGYFVLKQKRHSIDVGSTNSDEYLQSQTGNRRFWPLAVRGPIDIDRLRRDRLQLWGEAALCEAAGESLTLDKSLWGEAAAQQEERRTKDPWEDIIADLPFAVLLDMNGRPGEFIDVRPAPPSEGAVGGELVNLTASTVQIIHEEDNQERVKSSDILTYVLKVSADKQVHAHSIRLAQVMRRCGWERGSGKVAIGGRQVRGFFRWRRRGEGADRTD